MKNRVALLFVTIGISVGVGAEAQNLLLNPDFDTDLSNWTCTTGNGTVVRDTRDADGSGESGSLRTDNDAPANNTQIGCTQCVPAGEANQYRLSTSMYFAEEMGFTVDGTARMNVAFHADEFCSSLLAYGSLQIVGGFSHNANIWLSMSNEWSLAPTGTTHLLVTLTNWANTAGVPQRMLFDDVLLNETPAIFADGFESGNLDEWSSTVG